MVVATGLDRNLDLDAAEERRFRVEDEPVGTGCGIVELLDPPVVVGLAGRDELIAVEQLDAHAARRDAAAGIENVRRDHEGIFHCRAAVDKKSHSWRNSGLRDWP